MTEEKIPVYKNTEIAEDLFKTYLQTGSISATLKIAREKRYFTGAPTLRKMRDWHEWTNLVKERAAITLAVATESPEDQLAGIVARMTKIQKQLEVSPLDLDTNKLYGIVLAQYKLVTEMVVKEKEAAPEKKEKKAGGLSDEAAKNLREKILGTKG